MSESWTLRALLLGAALLLLPRAAQAQPTEATTPTQLAGTDAYISVPARFDPLHARPADLARYGFPPRPDPQRRPQDYADWSQAVTFMQRLAPTLQPVAIHHGPLQYASPRLAPRTANESAASTNWSGYVAPAPAFFFGAASIQTIYGNWSVPIAQPPFGACRAQPNGAAVYSSTWVGIDGSGSGDVLQAGTESDAVCSLGRNGPYQSAWYEWYPYNEVRITNLPLRAGSSIYAHVWATSATRGHAYIANRSAHLAVSIGFDAPPATKLIGNSAEWVVERPSVDGQLASLTNYVEEFFASAAATDGAGNAYFPGTGQRGGALPALQIQMTDARNQITSVPTLEGRSAIRFNDQGSALTWGE